MARVIFGQPVPARPLELRQRGREIRPAADAAAGRLPPAPTEQPLDLNDVEPFMSGVAAEGC